MKRSTRFTLALAFSLSLLAVSPALADGAVLDGAVVTKLDITADLLKSLPAVQVAVSFQTSKGKSSGTYTGAALWALLQKAGIAPGAGHDSELRHSLVVTGRDGYAVAIAVGEIDPRMEGKSVILAYQGSDGAATPTELRLVVPGDAHGGRSVRDVVHLELR